VHIYTIANGTMIGLHALLLIVAVTFLDAMCDGEQLMKLFFGMEGVGVVSYLLIAVLVYAADRAFCDLKAFRQSHRRFGFISA